MNAQLYAELCRLEDEYLAEKSRLLNEVELKLAALRARLYNKESEFNRIRRNSDDRDISVSVARRLRDKSAVGAAA